MPYLIRSMTEADLEAVLALEAVSVPIPWSRESYLNEIHNQWASYFVCEKQGELLGYCGIWNVFGECNIMTIVVAAAYRNQKIGRALMQAMETAVREKQGKKILLEVRVSNAAAIHLYTALGYVEIARRPAYYPDNQEDALILCKNLLLPEP